MTVIFYDVRRETYARVENVEQLTADQMKIGGRLANVWLLFPSDGSEASAYQQKFYNIHRIEA